MRILIVYCHPDSDSFGAAMRDAALVGAADGGHETRLIDLYAEGFDPVMQDSEWRDYNDANALPAELADHVEALRWAEGLVFVHPTWWAGPPAMLKGWLDRVWRPGIAFSPGGATGFSPELAGIRLIGVVTTLGSPRLVWALLGAPGRRMLLRGLRPCVARRARTFWLALHAIDGTTKDKRESFLARVKARLARPPGA